MASSKKRRKSANLANKQKQIQKGQARQRDGDRRHRASGKVYKEVLAFKRQMQQGDVPKAKEEEE